MPAEVLRYLKPQRGGIYVDATVGGGGGTGAARRAVHHLLQLLPADRLVLEKDGHHGVDRVVVCISGGGKHGEHDRPER